MHILLVGFKNWIGMWPQATSAALKRMGHTVNEFYYQDQSFSLENRAIARLSHYIPSIQSYLARLARVDEKLINTVKNLKPELVLVLKGETIKPETLYAIKQTNCLLATWWVDNPLIYGEAINGFSNYDAFFVFDSGYIPKLKSLDIPHVEFLPCAFAADIFYPRQLSPEDMARYQCDVAFVGGYFPPREALFKGLRDKNVAIWGPGGWQKHPIVKDYLNIEQSFRGLILPSQEAAKLYNAASICLNLNHHQTVFDGFNQRTVEIMACGGFQLVDYKSGFGSLFEANQEIVYYKSFEEVYNLVEYYLVHENERKEIARHGRENVIKTHSYEHRVETILAWATQHL